MWPLKFTIWNVTLRCGLRVGDMVSKILVSPTSFTAWCQSLCGRPTAPNTTVPPRLNFWCLVQCYVGDALAPPYASVAALRQLIDDHGAIHSDFRQVLLSANLNIVGDDGSEAHINITTRALLRNVCTLLDEVGMCAWVDMDHYTVCDSRIAARVVTQDNNHIMQRILVVQSTDENGATYEPFVEG